jgi:hypothetical protein
MLVERVRGSRRQRNPRLRLAFVGALMVAMLVALSAVGGLAYAGSAVRSAGGVFTDVFSRSRDKAPAQQPATQLSSSQSQYGKKTTMCHYRDGRPPQTITVSNAAVPFHLARGDTIGPCP